MSKWPPEDGKVKFGVPETDALYYSIKTRFKRSPIGGPILDELWKHAYKMEFALREAKKVRDVYPEVVRVARATAKPLGYAIAVHGTLARDIDLVAAPWTEDAVSAHALAKALMYALHGFIVCHPGTDPTVKPHGRLAWSIHLVGHSYADLSVMPRRKDSRVGRIAQRVRRMYGRLRGSKIISGVE